MKENQTLRTGYSQGIPLSVNVIDDYDYQSTSLG